MRSLFHKISYLQYPFILTGAYFVVRFALSAGDEPNLHYVNTALVFSGIAISLSTLQDTTTTQNEISRKVWEHPVKGKVMLGFLAVYAFAFIAFGMVGMLKSAGEMFENHRLDRRE